MIALIEEAKLKPGQALNEMHLLSELRIEALLLSAKHGLRRAHLENWCSLNSSRELSVIDAVQLVELIEIQHVGQKKPFIP